MSGPDQGPSALPDSRYRFWGEERGGEERHANQKSMWLLVPLCEADEHVLGFPSHRVSMTSPRAVEISLGLGALLR